MNTEEFTVAAGDQQLRCTYLSVGSQDDVVDTEACVRFAMQLFAEQRRTLPQDTLLSQLHVVDSPGHSPSRASRLQATQFLLDFCNRE